MTRTPAPRMITVLVTVTYADAEKYGPDAWLVNSVVDGEVDPYWTVETVLPELTKPGQSRRFAAALHLTRTQRDHRISRMGRLQSGAEADLQSEMDDMSLRAYRAELRLIAQGH